MPDPGRAPSQQEIAILRRLGVPDPALGADRVLIYDQAAHLDYDWLHKFPTYYGTGGPWGAPSVRSIYDQALTQMGTDPAFRYSTCEMAYLRAYVEDTAEPNAAAAIRAAGARFTVVGGGITSPDNLLPAGEAFIRNYLLGKLWLADTFPHLLPLRAAWIPDDFGHDPELPATLAALGLGAAAFERVPGTTWEAQRPALIQAMFSRGVDFRWMASDGSRVLASFLHGGYGQGADGSSVTQIQAYIDSYAKWQDPEGRGTVYDVPYGARTPYLYVPTDNDFSRPLPQLAADLGTWNAQQFPTTGVWAVPGSFLDFAALVEACASAAPHDPLETTAWDGTPYWTGHYASRPQLKVWHHGATRDLLAAEAVGLVADAGAGLWTQVRAAWEALVPSTHHDYVCGTASDNAQAFEDVYSGEQAKDLGKAAGDAAACASAAMGVLAAAVGPAPRAGETGLVVANPLGMPVAGLVELPAPVPPGVHGFRQGGEVLPAQATAEGGLVFYARLPGVGFATGSLTAEPGGTGPVRLTERGDDVWMENEHLRVRISSAPPFLGGIAELVDRATGDAVLAPGRVGNDVVIYLDSGNVWQFGYEFTDVDHRFTPVPITLDSVTVEVLERGTLRARVRTTVAVTLDDDDDSGPFPVIREYALGANEPFLRMTTTATAPPASTPPPPTPPDTEKETATGWTVVAAFPLAAPVDALVHGTPNHWTASQGQAVWPQPVFRATHRFVLPQAGGRTLAAIYHPEVPAWTWDGAGTLLGCVHRNVSGFPLLNDEPSSTQTVRYALRVPSGLAAPATGQPLAESLACAQPPMAAHSAVGAAVSPGWSLAEVTGGRGFILAAKRGDVAPGTLVLRLYQPTNGVETLEITLGRPAAEAIAVTALEDPIESGGPVIHLTGRRIVITLPHALATVQIRWAG